MAFKKKSLRITAAKKRWSCPINIPIPQIIPTRENPSPGADSDTLTEAIPPKTDDQLEAQRKSSQSSAAAPSLWEKIKGKVSNAIQAVQVGAETAGAPTGTGELVGGVKAATAIITELPIHVAKTKSLERKLEKKTGEDMAEYYWQINDCLSKQDFKRLLIIQGKLRRRLEELEKREK